MLIIDYIKKNGLECAIRDFKLVATDYPDRVVLNYNQIESPRFNPICEECRGLILNKADWSVISRAFDRFYNIGENNLTIEINKDTRIEEKVDGSIISFYYDFNNDKWQPATRKMAFAEGCTVYGNSFNDIFFKAIKNTDIIETAKFQAIFKNLTWIFELVSPETRIVTPYEKTAVILLGARDNLTGKEVDNVELNKIAKLMGVERPKSYSFTTIDEIVDQAAKLNAMAEGFVIINENEDGFFRLKCKNPKYLAIAHMRNNGVLSASRALKLVMENDYLEYLSYFEMDKPIFDAIIDKYTEMVVKIKLIWDEVKGIENQKEYALAIKEKAFGIECGVLFSLKKQKEMGIHDFNDVLTRYNEKRIVEHLNLDKVIQEVLERK